MTEIGMFKMIMANNKKYMKEESMRLDIQYKISQKNQNILLVRGRNYLNVCEG